MQKVGVYVNLGTYYIIGLPLAILLGFVLHQNGKVTKYYTKVLVVNLNQTLDVTRVVTCIQGLWTGIIGGSSVQAAILLVIILRIDWEQQVNYHPLVLPSIMNISNVII